MKAQRPDPLLPLFLPVDEYTAMFESDFVPLDLQVHILLLSPWRTIPGTHGDVEDRIAESSLLTYLSRSILLPPEAVLDHFCQSFSLFPCHQAGMPDLQAGWMGEDGYYLQIVFTRNLSVWGREVVALMATGMTLLDTLVAASGSVEPVDLKRIPYPPSCAEYGRLRNCAYGDSPGNCRFVVEQGCLGALRAGEALWNRQLMKIRNEHLIKLNAFLQRLDPEEEYDNFIAAGGTYFLEYPGICR